MKEKNDSIVFEPYKFDIEEKEDINEILDYSTILSEIAKALLKYRQNLDMTQKELAKKLRLRQSMISKLESGEYNPTLKMLLKISYKLEKNSEFFLTVIEDIRKTLEKTKQYKEIKKNLNYRNVQINNNIIYSSTMTYIHVDLDNDYNKYLNNNDNFKYKMNIQ